MAGVLSIYFKLKMMGGGRSRRLFIPYGFLLLIFFYPFCSHLSIETRSDLVSDQYLNLFIISELSKSLGSRSISNGTCFNVILR